MQTHAPAKASCFLPNLVVAVRVGLAFAAIALFTLGFRFAVAAVLLTLLVIALDALDGHVARMLGVASDLGGVLDITADRIVEHVFWIWFAVAHQVGVWVPMVVVTRSFVVDSVRSLAFARGATAFGEKTMMRSALTRFLVASRAMRNAYGLAKVAAFALLGALVALDAPGAPAAHALEGVLRAAALGAVLAAVVLNVIRGLPVVWDSRRYLLVTPVPAAGSTT